MIYCIEQNFGTQAQPQIYRKKSNALASLDGIYPFKKFDDFALYAQCDLVIKINQDGENISEKDAHQFYDEITVGIGFTALDIHDELNGIQVTWESAKDWENSCIIGEWFPMNAFKDIRDINFCGYKNREMMQMGNSESMTKNFNEIIALVSNQYPLQKGDLIFTGGIGMTEVFSGDAIELFLEDDTTLEFEIE